MSERTPQGWTTQWEVKQLIILVSCRKKSAESILSEQNATELTTNPQQYGQHMANIRTTYGQHMNNIWTRYGQHTAQHIAQHTALNVRYILDNMAKASCTAFQDWDSIGWVQLAECSCADWDSIGWVQLAESSCATYYCNGNISTCNNMQSSCPKVVACHCETLVPKHQLHFSLTSATPAQHMSTCNSYSKTELFLLGFVVFCATGCMWNSWSAPSTHSAPTQYQWRGTSVGPTVVQRHSQKIVVNFMVGGSLV